MAFVNKIRDRLSADQPERSVSPETHDDPRSPYSRGHLASLAARGEVELHTDESSIAVRDTPTAEELDARWDKFSPQPPVAPLPGNLGIDFKRRL